MSKWEDFELLNQYKKAQSKPGLYVIGRSRDPNSPPGASNQQGDSYLLHNWPSNFLPVYVGISESKKRGVKGRLSSHSRSKGNKHVKDLIKQGIELYFIAIYGIEATIYEPVFIALKKSEQFGGNVRPEHVRAAKKQYDKIRAKMPLEEREHYDNLNSEGDGM